MLPTNCLASLAVALAVTAPAKADPAWLSTGFSVERPEGHAADPRLRGSLEGKAGRFYGGVRGRTAPQPKHAADFDLYVGMRPHIGAVAVDVGYTRGVSTVASCCGTVALGIDRKLGASAVGGALRFDPGEAIARAEARAAVTLGRRTRISGSLGGQYDPGAPGGKADVSIDLGASRPLGPAWLDLRLTEASYSPGRAELTLQFDF